MKRIAEVMITGKTIAGKKRALGEILDEEVLGGIPHHVITAMVDSHMIRYRILRTRAKKSAWKR